MVGFLVYFAFLLILILTTRLFGLLNDEPLRSRVFALSFAGKALAVPVFYLVYARAYGGIADFDAGKFFHDAETIGHYGTQHPLGYLKLLFGLQDDSPGSALYQDCIRWTYNWDNGDRPDLFYNDNRIVIRLHSLLSFISFGSYFVQALFNCFIGFVGLVLLYKALRDYFKGRELLLLLVLCFFPSLWFYCGAVLKEGLAMFFMGATAWMLKRAVEHKLRFTGWVTLALLLWLSLLHKPYLLVPTALCLCLLFILDYRVQRYKTIYFLVLLASAFGLANLLSHGLQHQSLEQIATERAREFADVARGGIFLLDEKKFVRLDYDSTLVERINGRDSCYRIRAGVPFTYWEHQHQQDTLYVASNQDTATVYKLVYLVPKSGSNISRAQEPFRVSAIAGYFYYSLFFPLFVNAQGPLQWMASAENCLLAFSLLVSAIGLLRNKRASLPAIVWLSLALLLCLVIGASTPNSGAIFRYRAPVVIFILLSALYYLPQLKVQRPRSGLN